MGCIQSKDKGYSIPDLQSNEINNPMKESSSDKTNTSTSDTDKPLSPKELMMLKRSDSTCSNGEDKALLDRTPPAPTQRKVQASNPPSTPDTPTKETVISPPPPPPSPSKSPSKSSKKSPKNESRKLSVSELLIQEKMKKKLNGKSGGENEVSYGVCIFFCVYDKKVDETRLSGVMRCVNKTISAILFTCMHACTH